MKMLRKLISKASFILIPLYKIYARKKHQYKYQNLSIVVYPFVFNPMFFYSTKDLITYIDKNYEGSKQLLELGCGSGMLSVYFAKKNWQVSACDINPEAVKNIQENAEINKVNIDVFESDLLKNVPLNTYDIIAINPPYYSQNAKDVNEMAWYCGNSFQYFKKLFSQLEKRNKEHEEVVMVLSDKCDLQAIVDLASEHELNMTEVKRFNHFSEEEIIYQIKRIAQHAHSN